MPKRKDFYINLPKLISRDAIDKMMLGYVMGYKYQGILPVIKVKEAIMKFMEDFNLTDEEYPLESAIKTFYDIFDEFKVFRTSKHKL